jgi:hypothetical protein
VTDAATTLLTALAGLTVITLALQGADLVTLGVEDTARRRNARDTAPGRATRQFWSVIVPALAALLLAVGVDVSARLILGGELLVGIGLVAPLALLLIAVVAVAVLVQQREPVDGLTMLERRLAEVPPTARPSRGEVEAWRRELADLDHKNGSGPVRRPAWLSWRLAPAVLPALFLIAAVWGAVLGVPAAALWLTCAVLGLAGSIVLGMLAARFAARTRLEAARTRAGSRIEIVRMLQDLELRTQRRVPGFGDRVARALAILREQQKPGGQPPRDR